MQNSFIASYFSKAGSYMLPSKRQNAVVMVTLALSAMLALASVMAMDSFGASTDITPTDTVLFEYTSPPGGSFSIPFTLENNGDGLVQYNMIIEDMPPSFQPRIFINGSESDSATLEEGETLVGSALVQAPWVLTTGTYKGNLSISSEDNETLVPFTVHLVVPELTISADDKIVVSDQGEFATIKGTLHNPSVVHASEVTLSVYVKGEVVAQQSYEKVSANSSISFVLRWPVFEGSHEAVLTVSSKDGASSTYTQDYSVERSSGISSDTIILVGGVLALIFPLVVLAQSGIQKRRERRAIERRERERQLSSALLTIEEEEKR